MTIPQATATAYPEHLADWIELTALASKDGRASIQDLRSAIRRSGTTDALEEFVDAATYNTDPRSERSETIAEDAFGDVELRARACGDAYPFTVESRHIEVRNGGLDSIYAFLLLLSRYGKDAGPKGTSGAQLFEDVCSAAAAAYFGGDDASAHSRVFGFPRRILPKGFENALDTLCREMGEGGGCSSSPRSRDQKDGKLDVVAWTEFPDGQQGKLVAFGQCATGDNWLDKATETQPDHFCTLWMREAIRPQPIRLFFVPHRIDRTLWREVSVKGGIPFDRCRIAALAGQLDATTVSSCAAWARHAFREKVQA